MKTRRTTSLRMTTSPLALRASLGAVALGASLSFTDSAAAQSFPFPSTNVSNGVTTSVLTSHELKDLYNFWEQTFIEDCGQDKRLRYPESGDDTRSEGVGYGMVIAAYMGDEDTFDGLWRYYKRASPSGDASSLMHWKRNGCDAGGGGGDNGSASDADIDAAFALIVAEQQFPGNNYGAEAGQLVATIRQQLFQGGCQGILTAGSQFSDCGCINPSYIPPGYYTSFGNVDQVGFWNTARDASYAYFESVSNNNTGLVPAWSSSNGSLNLGGGCNPQVSGGGEPNEFQADAARTPWRVAADYMWTGDTRAQSFLSSIADFAQTQRIVQIVDRYSLGGQALNGNGQGNTLDATGFRSTFTMGGFATAMSASSQNSIDEFTGAWQSLYRPGDNIGAGGFEPRAFNTSLALLYGLTVTGFAWDPAGAAPSPVAEPVLVAQGQNLLVNGDFDEGILGWEMGAFGDGASEAFAMHLNGEVNFRIQEIQTDEPYNLQFFQDVSIVAGQRYLLSVRARATEPRQLRVQVGENGDDYTTYGQLVNRFSTDAPLTLTADMADYETVFESPDSDAAARFAFQLGDSLAGVTIDNVTLVPTDREITQAGDLVGVPVPNGEAGPPGEQGQDTPDNTGNGDATGGNATGGQLPGQTVGQPNDSSTGGVPAPSGDATGVSAPDTPSGFPSPLAPNTACTGEGLTVAGQDCFPYSCSPGLGICYDPATGYVYDDSRAQWSLPPDNGCGTPFLFLPGTERCYDPVSGYIFDEDTGQWVYWGDNFSAGPDPVETDGGCSISAIPANSSSNDAWWSVAALGLAAALRSFRRKS